MPAFPCGGLGAPSAAVASDTTTPLSLADALQAGQTTPQQRTPLSLASSLAPAPSPAAALPETAAAAPGLQTPGAGQPKTFSFTIRKADNADLGLNVSHQESDRVLQVEGIRPEGAVEAWNRQCNSGGAKDKAVLPRDRIIQVNEVAYDPEKMLEECRDKQLLRLTIVRGGEEASLQQTALKGSPTVLRADASVFVPRTAIVPDVISESATDTPPVQPVSPVKEKETSPLEHAQDTDGATEGATATEKAA